MGRFLCEKCPNVVAAYEADECRGGHFLVMEFVDGEDLSSTVRRHGPMSITAAVSAVRQAAEALAYAHRYGVVHRDNKPANLLRSAQGVVKVADLGLARLNGESEHDVTERAALTQAGTSLGTVDYMPAEQALDASSVDARADIYSLGCTLHFLLTGRPVYDGDNLMARLLAHRDAPIPSLRRLRPEVSLKLDELFSQMVAKRPEDRCASMNEVVSILRTFETPASSSSEIDPSSLVVLLIEPSTFQAKVVGQYLHTMRIDDVHIYRSAQETIDAISRLRPEAVVCSFQLPDGNGIEFQQRLRDDLRWMKMHVIVLTSAPLSDTQLQFFRNNPTLALLTKPFREEQLADAIRSVIAASQIEPETISRLNLRRVLFDPNKLAEFFQLGVSAICNKSSLSTCFRNTLN